jgi:transposase
MAKRTRTGRGVEGRPGRRYELTDEGFERIEPLLPAQRRGGRWADHRTVLNGMFWVLNSGAPWRDLPPRYGKWQSGYHRYRRWTRDGLIEWILRTLQLELDDQGRIDWSQFNIDGSSIRAQPDAAGARKKRGPRKSLSITDLDDHEGVGVRSFIW